MENLYNSFTTLPEAKKINCKLKEMYKKWQDVVAEAYNTLDDKENWCDLQLLTCFDPYIKASGKIMFYGKEAAAHAGDPSQINPLYQTDKYYSYDTSIVNRVVGNNEPDKARNTEFNKARKVICGIEEKGETKETENQIYEKLFSVLHNNLNKTSKNGKYEKRYDSKRQCSYLDFQNAVYKDFEFDGFTGNVFLHEIRILKPNKLLFISGTGYDKHIIGDFGEAFYNNVVKCLINELNKKETPDKELVPMSHTVIISPKQIKDMWKIDNYTDSISVAYAYYPYSGMTRNLKCLYYDKIKAFISD